MLTEKQIEKDLQPRRFRRAAARALWSMRNAWARAAHAAGARAQAMPQGISALVRVKDEEFTIAQSLRSIEDHVDEFVVVDASQDRTPDLVQDFARTSRRPLIHLRPPAEAPVFGRGLSTSAAHAAESEAGLRRCTRRWVLKWDGDFIARDGGEWSFANFRKRLLNLDPSGHYTVHYPHVRLAGDVRHTLKGARFHREPWAFTNSDKIHFRDWGRFEGIHFPWVYVQLKWASPYSFHVADLKPLQRLLMRRFWTDWRQAGDHARWPTLESFAAERVRAIWPGATMAEAMHDNFRQYCGRLVPYEPRDLGPLPSFVEEVERLSPFRPQVQDGQLVGRIEGKVGASESSGRIKPSRRVGGQP